MGKRRIVLRLTLPQRELLSRMAVGEALASELSDVERRMWDAVHEAILRDEVLEKVRRGEYGGRSTESPPEGEKS